MRVEKFGLLVAIVVVVCAGCGGSEGTAPTSSSGSGSSAPSRTEELPAEAATEPVEQEVVELKEGWGHFKGKFVVDGSPKAPSKLSITKDPEFCGQHDIVDESVLVNKENGGLANVVVNLYIRRGQDPPLPHESYNESEAARVILDNDKCRFEPHICLLRTTQTLVIKNSDPVGHNTNIATTSNPSFNQTIPSGAELEQRLSAAERRPAAVGCNIHPWMKGWLLPLETPYFAISDSDGTFEIKNIPSGEWTFQVWHETAGSVTEVTIDGKAANWSKGRVDVAINGDETLDLGEIKLAADAFDG